MRPKNQNHDKANPNSPACDAPIAHQIINLMPIGSITFDQHFTILDANPQAQHLLADAKNLPQALQAGSPNQDPNHWQNQLESALKNHQPTTFENINYHHQNHTAVLRLVCTPLAPPQNTIHGILFIEDITAQVAMQNDLASAERLAAVGKLAAKVAHELNNPLDGILRYINLAARVASQHQLEQIDQYLLESRKGLLRMTRIVSELLDFSRSTSSAAEEADINKIVEEAIRAMEPAATECQVNIIRQFSQPMPNIRSGNLFQVFTNLIKNAIDAMTDGGKLTVTTRCDDHYALIQFADEGTGLASNVKKNMFEPFFTTKHPGKGTGLGLAICKDIIEQYRGNISAENRKCGGATFTIKLPLETTRFHSIENHHHNTR